MEELEIQYEQNYYPNKHRLLILNFYTNHQLTLNTFLSNLWTFTSIFDLYPISSLLASHILMISISTNNFPSIFAQFSATLIANFQYRTRNHEQKQNIHHISL